MSLKKNEQDQSTTLIYLHIPKAGGSTFENILWRIYGPNAIFRLPSVRTERTPEIERFQKMPDSKKQSIKVVTGIMDYGFHKYLPQPSTYVTILRNPVDRIISHYNFVCSTPEHHLYSKMKTLNISLKDYLTTYPHEEMDNGQTRLISGMDAGHSVSLKRCTRKYLEIAKKNLRKYFAVIGILERYDDTLVLMKRKLGWQYPVYVKHNITKKTANKQIDQNTIRLIKMYNALDIELYRYVKECFEESLEHEDIAFKQNLITFRVLNTLYGHYPNIYSLFNRAVLKFQRLRQNIFG